jgi:LuxR family maltose regulon positive regulatory protein
MLGLRYWAGKLSKELVFRRPWLCIYEAYSHAWFGELDQADIFLQAAERRLESEPSNPETDSMAGHLIYVKCRVTAMRGDLSKAIEFNLAARKHLPPSNEALRLDLGITLGYVYFLNGEYSQANQYLSETIRTGREIGAMLNTVAGYCILARMRANQGRLRDSYRLYQQAAEWICETGEQHLGASSLIEMGMADVLCEWNELEAALEHVRRGLAYIHLWGKADDFILACITATRIHTARGEKAAAAEALEKACHSARTYGVFPEAPQSLELAQVKLWQNQGDVQAAKEWMASVQERLETGDPFRFPNEVTHIARARVFIAQEKPEEAIALLSRLEAGARSERRMGRLIEMLMLKARALQQAGIMEEALLSLEECRELAEPEGYARIFLDEGESMCSLLEKLGRKRSQSPGKAYIGRLVEGYH